MSTPIETALPGTPTAETPTAGHVARRLRIWAVLAAALVVVLVVVVAVLSQPRPAAFSLSTTSGAPDGTRALARVLEGQGVDVIATDTLAEVRRAATDRDQTTILLFDIDFVLGSEQRTELLRLADHVVVVVPYDEELADLAPGVVSGADVYGVTDADCDVPAAEKAGTVDADGWGYVLDGAEPGTVGCFDGGSGFGLVQAETDGTRVSVLGLWPVLTNGQITREGNAALALNLLGEHETLVWYVPSFEDAQAEDIPSVAALTPAWVTPLALLALLVVIAAGFWRGRRLGPLVVENLPVVVRADETMEGRARLYERHASRGHAADALRIGTISRLAARAGLPRAATVTEVIDAIADLTGRDRFQLRHLLVDAVPTTDADLVRISDDLTRLELDTDAAVRGR